MNSSFILSRFDMYRVKSHADRQLELQSRVMDVNEEKEIESGMHR